MQFPLLHRTTQLTMLRRQIKRKGEEVRQQKRRARRRLELMRRIRVQLLRRVQFSIDAREREAEQERREQARRSLGAMLKVYRRWLRRCSKSLRQQRQEIIQQEQLELQLQQRLYLLRKQLKKRRRPQHMVDRCIQRLAKAVRKWQKSSDIHPFLKDHDNIWESEAAEIREYLTHLHGKPLKWHRRGDRDVDQYVIPDFTVTYKVRRKKRRRRKSSATVADKIEDFAKFWNHEVLKKRPKSSIIRRMGSQGQLESNSLQYRKDLASKKLYSVPPSVTFRSNLNIFKRDSKHSVEKSDPKINQITTIAEKPTLYRLKQLLGQLMSINSKLTASATGKRRRTRRRRKKRKIHHVASLDSTLEARTTILRRKVIKLRRRRRHRRVPNTEVNLEDFHDKFDLDHMKPKRLRRDSFGVGQGPKMKKKSRTRFRYGPTRDMDLESGTTDDLGKDKPRKRGKARRSSSKSKRESNEERGSEEKVSPSISDTGTEYMARKLRKQRRIVETSPSITSKEHRDSVTSFSESVKDIIMTHYPRMSFRRSLPRPRLSTRPRVSKGRLSISIGRKGQAVKAKPSSRQHPIEDDAVNTDSSYKIGKKVGNRIGDQVRGQIGYKPSRKSSEDFGKVPFIDMVKNLVKTPAKEAPRPSSKQMPKDSPKTSTVDVVVEDSEPERIRFGASKLNYQGLADSEKSEKGNVGDPFDAIEKSLRDMELEVPEQGKFVVEDMKTDFKFRRLQRFLKDIIENNPIMDFAPDVKALMNEVGKHPMWNSLLELYNEMTTMGVSKEDKKKVLASKYMEYLKNILNELRMSSFAQPLPPRDADNNVILIPEKGKLRTGKIDHLMAKRPPKKTKGVSRREQLAGDGDTHSQGSQIPHEPHQLMDDLMYRKIIEQELKVARLIREERRRRMQSYPSFSRTYTSQSTSSYRSIWDVDPSEEDNIREAEKRYSAKSLYVILNKHRQMFQV